MSRNRTMRLGPALCLLILIALPTAGVLNTSSSQSQPQPKRPVQGERPAKPVSEDEPVAVTDPRSVESAPVAERLGPNQFGSFYGAQINNDGDVTFIGRYSDPTVIGLFGQGVFVKTKAGQWRYVRNSDKVSNLEERMINVGPFGRASNGSLIFTATFGKNNPLLKPNPDSVGEGGSTNSSNSNLGIFVWKDGILSNLYHLGVEVPNLPSRFSGFSNPSINSKGTIAFVGAYVDPDGRGIFLVEEGKLRIAARSGQKISAKENLTFSEHFYPSRINEKGEVAFFARIGSGSAVMVSRPTGIDIIARDNMLSPIRGGKYIGFGNRAPAINDKGDVAYAGFYSGANAGRALFVKGIGPARVAARTGDPATKFAFSDFMQPSLNNIGDVVFVGRVGGRSQGVFLKTARGIEVIARSEEVPPGFEKGAEFNNFHMPSVNDHGEVVFYAQLKNAKYGIFKKDSSGLKMFIQRGDPLPFETGKQQ